MYHLFFISLHLLCSLPFTYQSLKWVVFHICPQHTILDCIYQNPIMHNHPIKSYTNQTKLWLLYFYSRYWISIVWLLCLWMDMHDILLRLFSVLKQGAMMSFKSTTLNLFSIYVLEETCITIFSQRLDNLITLRKIIK